MLVLRATVEKKPPDDIFLLKFESCLSFAVS